MKQVFEEFDKSRDGSMQKQEFISMIRQVLKTEGTEMSQNEYETLWQALDVDDSGTISQAEFMSKMERFGLLMRSNDEHIMYQLLLAIEKTGMKNLSEFFQIADKSGRGYITKEDFADLFHSKILKIDQKSLDHFMNQFWKDSKAGIDYEGFLRIFKRF